MAISITVKNTFLSWTTPLEEEPVRRSSSVPRTFKPGCCTADLISDDSTSASDKDSLSGHLRRENFATTSSDVDTEDLPDYRSDCTDYDSEFCNPCAAAWETSSAVEKGSTTDALDGENPKMRPSTSDKVTLSLDCMVSDASEKVRVKLKTTAKPFKSLLKKTATAEVMTVVASAVEVLSTCEGILGVQVHDGGMGGTTMIVGKSAYAQPEAERVFSKVKDALLLKAEQSEKTYILGYGAQPFNNLDDMSFSANIASVPEAHQDTACWETYEKGYCPRCASCRWDHPRDIDQVRVIVMIQKATLPLTLGQYGQ